MSTPLSRRTAVIVSPVLPVPEIQGNRRVIAELVRWLAARGYAVKYVVQGSVKDPAIRAAMQALGAEVIPVERKPPPPRTRAWRWGRRIALEARRFDRWNRRVMGLRIQTCGWLAGWEERIAYVPNRECWPETIAMVRHLVEQGAGLVISEYVYHTPVLENLPAHVLTAVHTHDCLSQVWEKMGRSGIDTHAREISRALEGRCLGRARVVLALQQDEAATFRALAPGPQTIVLGFSPGSLPAVPTRGEGGPVVFFPASNNPANRAGLRWLLDEVWPRIRAGWPEAELRVAGEVSKWLGAPAAGVTALGSLPNLDAEYARACVVVNPVAVGTGLKIKTVEALALGQALVSTSNGVEGLHASPAPWLVADEPQAFADAVVALGADRARRNALAASSLEFARAQLTRDAVFAEFARVLDAHEEGRAR